MEPGNLSSKRQRDPTQGDGRDRGVQASGSVPRVPRRRRATIAALIATAILSSGLVVATYLALSEVETLRVVTSLVMPFSLIWLLIFATSIWWFATNRFGLGLAYFLLWLAVSIMFNGTVASWVIRSVEWPRDAAIAELKEPFRAVVLLGGSAQLDSKGTPEIGREGMRVFSAAQFWHAGHTRGVICTGERAGPGDHQSQLARQLLASAGVPDDVIFEIGGENTTQEMRNLRRLLDSPPAGIERAGSVGLITSAYHMRRAMRLAEANGLELVPLPCSYRDTMVSHFTPNMLVPDVDAGVTMRLALKERLAALVGR